MRWHVNGNRRNNHKGCQLTEMLERRMLLAAELVCDVNPGAADAFQPWFSPGGSEGLDIDKVTVNGTLYFDADDGVHGEELWKSDGTTAGTMLVKDIRPGSATSLYASSDCFTDCNGTLLFFADDGEHGIEPWKSDGTAAGTVILKDIKPGVESSMPSLQAGLGAVNGLVFFVANDGAHGQELWRTDGTVDGTFMVQDIRGGKKGSEPSRMAQINGTLYFCAMDDEGEALWRTDGTAPGTAMLQRVSPDMELRTTVVGNTFYFVGYDSTHGSELWKSDGTAAGTALLKDINPGGGYGYAPSLPVLLGDQLIFFAHDSLHGWELWRSDGTTGGTAMVKDILPGDAYSNTSGQLLLLNGELFFAADDGVHGEELWKSDGTAAGTKLVREINPSGDAEFYPDYESPFPFINVNKTIFFSATDGTHGRELWKSDGTAAGTKMVKDLTPGADSSTLLYPVVFGNELFFWDADGRLWKSDGSSQGTVIVKDVGGYPPYASDGWEVQTYDANLLFIAGGKLWQSDGTSPGTTAILTLKSWIPRLATEVSRIDNQLIFVASDGASGLELWTTAVPYAAVLDGVLRIFGTESSDTISLTIRSDTLRVRRNGELETFAAGDVSRIEIEALGGNDIVDFSGISIPTYVNAGPGNDSITAGGAKDTLTGGAGKDALYGGEGDDRINGLGTNDRLFGEAGADRIYGGAHNDYIDGGGGVDRIWGEAGNDTLCGAGSNDKIDGGLDVDSILGGKGNDLLTCGGGADLLFGNDGNDTLSAADSAADLLDGGLGTDSALGDSQDVLSGIES